MAIIIQSFFSFFVGTIVGGIVGYGYDIFFINVTNLYKLPVGAVVTPGILLGVISGGIGGIISNFLIGDFGVTGGVLTPLSIYVFVIVNQKLRKE